MDKAKVESIRSWLKDSCDVGNPSHQRALHRGCLIIYANQTTDEQSAHETNHLNGRGFNGRDAAFGSAMAERILAINEGRSQYPSLSPKMYACLRRMLVKYARQIAEATTEAAAEPETASV